MNVTSVLPRDAIPSIDEPSFATEYFGEPDDEAIVVDGSPPRAYPIRILSYHEIVNDVLEADGSTRSAPAAENGRPITVTWCPICASAVVYDRVVDGRRLMFGTSGKLADDALVMYDRETGSEWKQPLGTCIDGPLEGEELSALPASLVSMDQFRSAHPDGVVLQPVHGSEDGRLPRAVYGMEPYDRYFADEEFGLRAMRGEGEQRTWVREDIDSKTPVLGVVHGGEAVGYPRPQVEAAGGVVTDSVGGLDVVVLAFEGGLHAFEDPEYRFEVRDGSLIADGSSWDPATGRSDDGRQLDRVPSRRLFAFAWRDDHGDGSFYGLD
ncbi:MAG: DUF3179 domain-containing protein [Halalkalicoccus sp.]|nr:DUF3179 domain-containing protein [Halalkalicoccus sp.]